RGSVSRIVDASGVLVGTMAYEAWGKVTSSSGNLDRYGYTGRERDDDTGFQFNRNRYYDVATGRWVNPDPSGFSASNHNLYRYVGNNPTNLVDPSGLAPPYTTAKPYEDLKTGLPPIAIFQGTDKWKHNWAAGEITGGTRYEVTRGGGGKTFPDA